MADIFETDKRSYIMSRIRSTGTAPERQLYRMLRDILGHRWRIDLNVHGLPGRPDIVVPSLQIALFADGCFYHMCPKHGHVPKSNTEYWAPKLARNVTRDRRAREQLRRLGYRVWRIWEHELRPKELQRTQRRISKRFDRLMAVR